MAGRDDRSEDVVLDSLELIDSHRQLAVLYQLQTGTKQFDELQACGFVECRLGTGSELETDYQCSQELTGADPGGEDALVPTTYALTTKGDALKDVFVAIESWGVEWLEASDQTTSYGA